MAPFKLDKSAKKRKLFAFRVWFNAYGTEFGQSFDMTRNVQTLWLIHSFKLDTKNYEPMNHHEKSKYFLHTNRDELATKHAQKQKEW